MRDHDQGAAKRLAFGNPDEARGVIIPAAAVIPTKDRAVPLRRTLNSLLEQGVAPAELVVVDASANSDTQAVMADLSERFPSGCDVRLLAAHRLGAATQRAQGVTATKSPFVWFLDDDILFEPDCVMRLWSAISSDNRLGGVNAMIVNQKYHPPGWLSRVMFHLLNGRREPTYAGKILGPAINLLPEDRTELPDVVPVEWLNTTCTIYRRSALPEPVFDRFFTGYSLMEDVALSLRVGRNWRLANARTARIFHDSQPGTHKSDPVTLAEMELANRLYVMRKVLQRTGWNDHARLLVWECFGLATSLASSAGRRGFLARLTGKVRALGNN